MSPVEQAALPPQPVLRPVRGPTATGGGWHRFFGLLWLIAVTDFKKSYFGTVFGYLWSLARPLMLFGVLLAVFTQVFRVGSDVPNYPVLLLLNVVMFGFFQESTVAAVGSVVGQEAVVRKTQFPRLVIPLSVVLTAAFNLVLNLIVVFLFMIFYGVTVQWTWLLFPIIFFALLGITVAASMLLSALYVRFRDMAIIWSVLVTVLFYGTPVLYPLADNVVPESIQRFIVLNPLTLIFEQMRKWIIDPAAQGAVAAAGGPLKFLFVCAIYVAICVLAVWYFRREAPRIAEEL